MTTNQLKFAELQEKERHNLVTEKHSSQSVQESIRSNLEKERINWYSAISQREVGLGQVSASLKHADAAMSQAVASQSQAISATRQADAALWNAATREGELAERERHQSTERTLIMPQQAFQTFWNAQLAQQKIEESKSSTAYTDKRAGTHNLQVGATIGKDFLQTAIMGAKVFMPN